MKRNIYLFSEHKNIATDEFGFLWKFNKSRNRWLPMKLLKHPQGSRVYFSVMVDAKPYEYTQENLAITFKNAFEKFREIDG